jgi:hypothetical protein
MPKANKNFRPDLDLLQAVDAFAGTHKLKDPQDDSYVWSDALHGLFRELSAKAKEAEAVAKDRDTWKLYAQSLEKDKPVFCAMLTVDISKQRCYNCAVTKLKSTCDIGFDIRANRMTVEAAHQKAQNLLRERQQTPAREAVPPLDGEVNIG